MKYQEVAKDGQMGEDRYGKRHRRENSLDMNITPIEESDKVDYGESLYYGNMTAFRGQVCFHTLPGIGSDPEKAGAGAWKDKDHLFEDFKYDWFKMSHPDFNNISTPTRNNEQYVLSFVLISVPRDAHLDEKKTKIRIAKEFNLASHLCNQEMDNWRQQADEEQEYAPNILPVYGFEYYCYYLVVFLTVSLFGPISGLLFFVMPTLFKDDVNIIITKTQGFQVPLFLWFSFSLLWLAGEGPMVCGQYIPFFKQYVLKSDLYLQGFSRMCLLACFSLMYNKILSLYEFVSDNEVSQTSWKFAQWKHNLQIDEATFNFDLICKTGEVDQPQRSGCKFLPHLKKNMNQGKFLMLCGCIPPILFFIVYAVDLSDPVRDAEYDPRQYKCSGVKSTNATLNTYNCVYNGSNNTYTRISDGKNFSYVPLTWNGDGARDTFSTIIGYIVEIILIGVCYNLLYNTIQIHQTFCDYLYALLNIQSYECSGKQLDEFWKLTQQEFLNTAEDLAVFTAAGKTDPDGDPLTCWETEDVLIKAKLDPTQKYTYYWDNNTGKETHKPTLKEQKDPRKRGVVEKQRVGQTYAQNPDARNKQVNTPIDMANMKNINNLIILRKMAFGIYQPLSMSAQWFIILMTLVFGTADYILYASIKLPYDSKFNYFYGLYPPSQLWYYWQIFQFFFLCPILITFLYIFTLEMYINQYFVEQQVQWAGTARIFNRLSNFGSHYFDTGYDPDNKKRFKNQQNTLLVMLKASGLRDMQLGDTINDRFYKEKMSLSQRSALITESDNSYIAYLVKRLCEDHGFEGEDTSILLGNFSGALGQAISDMNSNAITDLFYFMGFFAINTTFIKTAMLAIFWILYGVLKNIVSKSISLASATKKKQITTTTAAVTGNAGL